MTTTETVTTAVATRDNSPGALIAQYRSDFALVLPSHVKPETWVRLAQGVFRRDENLTRIAQRNPGSLMQALLECARLGHEPGTESFYLVPMGNEIEGWEGYRGVIERMFRAGAVLSVKAELVRANDEFVYNPAEMDRPVHKVDWFGDRGGIVGAYSYAVMRGGITSRVVVINRDYIEQVRAMSRGSDKPSSPWKKWEEAMVLKTVIHRLEPFVPTSSEYRESVAARPLPGEVDAPAAALAAALPPAPLPHDGEVVDGELLPTPHAFVYGRDVEDDNCATCGELADADVHGGRA